MEMNAHIQQLFDELDAAEHQVTVLRLQVLMAYYRIPREEAARQALVWWPHEESTTWRIKQNAADW